MKQFLAILVLALLLSIPLGQAAATLEVEKTVENTDIKAGEEVTVILRFVNPFGEELPIRIIDKNILGGNGLDVQCLEFTLPSDKKSAISYEPIISFSPGTFTLDAAEITYTNPITGKKETARSNSLNVKVTGQGHGTTQGITTVYQCGGVSMRSSSFSSGSSFGIQMGQGAPSLSKQRRRSPQDRLQNNQMNQNTQQLKQSIEKRRQEEQEFQEKLGKTPEFQETQSSLSDAGYNLNATTLNISSNDTGDFQMTYQKPTGETAQIKGRMDSGKVEELTVLTQKSKDEIMRTLKKEKKFQNSNRKLEEQGFKQGKPSFKLLRQNHTRVKIPYTNEKQEKATITAEYINGTVQNIRLEGGIKKEKPSPWQWLLILATLIISALAGRRILKRLNKPPVDVVPAIVESSILRDPQKEAAAMLAEAETLFKEGRPNDACEKISYAIRFYFSEKLSIKREITSKELLNILKQKQGTYENVQRCLESCYLTEFAKHKPSRKEFDELIHMATSIIS